MLRLGFESGLSSTVEKIQKLGCRAVAAIGDVTQAADLNQAVDTVEKELGPLSGVLNCAGIANAAPAEEMPLEHLSKSLAMEWSDRGVRVNSISPGYTATPMNLRPEMTWQTKKLEADTPMGRMANVDELVEPAIFFVQSSGVLLHGRRPGRRRRLRMLVKR
jgi:NAD(P)-dependent dehydrogenase (short-subunit alcohol dehydrogenase family)